MTAASSLSLSGVTKYYGTRCVVDRIDLDIAAGEFCTLLGPSGCGKTTTLRMIAGLERPDNGEVALGDRQLSSAASGQFIEPDRRGMGMVFQSYAVWPHMTVGENVAFPLKLRGVLKAERAARVDETLELVGLGPFRDNPATNLSGGQQQRVAIARAIVYRPEVLLLDEPLSNLDAKLREQMRGDLRRIQQQLGTTTIMVTHDRDEAMAVSDRIVVMNAGRIEQAGPPEQLYAEPANAFVMEFLGHVNRLDAHVLDAEGLVAIAGQEGAAARLGAGAGLAGRKYGAPVTLCLRREDLHLVLPGEQADSDWPGTIETATFLGERVDYSIRLGTACVRVEAPASPRFEPGDTVRLRPRLDQARIWTDPILAANG